MADVICDLCGGAMVWTDADIRNDVILRLHGFGLGKMCDACAEKDLANSIAEERRARRMDSARERRERQAHG